MCESDRTTINSEKDVCLSNIVLMCKQHYATHSLSLPLSLPPSHSLNEVNPHSHSLVAGVEEVCVAHHPADVFRHVH